MCLCVYKVTTVVCKCVYIYKQCTSTCMCLDMNIFSLNMVTVLIMCVPILYACVYIYKCNVPVYVCAGGLCFSKYTDCSLLYCIVFFRCGSFARIPLLLFRICRCKILEVYFLLSQCDSIFVSFKLMHVVNNTLEV